MTVGHAAARNGLGRRSRVEECASRPLNQLAAGSPMAGSPIHPVLDKVGMKR
jgi:hypothetical protein